MKQRLQIRIHGAVQGVGFRPFIYNLASRLHLNGYVQNNNSGVLVEVEGETRLLSSFLNFVQKEKPCNALIDKLNIEYYSNIIGFQNFEIKESISDSKSVSALLLPDVAVCNDCLKELFDKNNRRYLYPFINCTNCGPRFSIIESLPYDRKNTSMKKFRMCTECRNEYENPADRRFHAQPIACPKCGPHMELWNNDGKIVSSSTEAIIKAAALIKSGKIIALKGLGGFQFVADAGNDETVQNLRKRKRRDEKPFATMFPDIDSISRACYLSLMEEKLLLTKESPIVLLRRKQELKDQIISSVEKVFPHIFISDFVAPGNPYLGVMLPYTPLHHILMRQTGMPLIATSGNFSEEPMCIDEYEAVENLKDIADFFLIHNRPVTRFVDDSVARVVHNHIMIMRRARGYAPLPVSFDNPFPEKTILAVGGQLKNTVAINVGSGCFLSQHIGDLTNPKAMEGFQKAINDCEDIYKVRPELTVCDLHPDYLSAKFAENSSKNLVYVQHHIAHIASCIAENHIKGDVLGVAWDGTGYGHDGTVWGGEFFLTDGIAYKHFAQIRKFELPGGEIAIKDIRRSALGVLFEIFDSSLQEMDLEILKNFSKDELRIFNKMLEKKLNCVATSSMGRLFDAAAAITGIALKSSFEGQAAMMFEFAADPEELGSYNFKVENKEIYTLDWKPLFEELLIEVKNKINPGVISAKFHNTLVNMIQNVAMLSGRNELVLSGGCFQNTFLLERTINTFQSNGLKVFWQQNVPTNDGGIALGQLAYAFNQINKQREYKN